jgi:hypothetical protein
MFVETRHVVFLENDGISGNLELRKIDLEEKRVYVASPLIPQINFPVPRMDAALVVLASVTRVAPPVDSVATLNVEVFEENVVHANNEEPQQAHTELTVEPVQTSQRERSAIPRDYEVYMNQDANDIGKADDPSSYKEAMKDENSSKRFDAMKDEIKSMDINKVWDLVESPNRVKTVGCKWIYKTKCDSKGNIERYKVRLVAKSFTQREGIDYNEIFSPVSTKDSFRIIMALTTYYDLELNHMDVKTAFSNGDLEENMYMTQPKGFVVEGKKHLGCKLKKSIYDLKQTSRQWYLKFDEVIRRFGFKENMVDICIYVKFKGSKFTILVLYIDYVLLASSDIDILLETKRFLSSNFDMKDLGEAPYGLCIEIHQDRSKGILGLYQKAYIDSVLKRFNMHKCCATPAPVVKGNKFEKFQSPKTQYEIDRMKDVLYASTVGSIMYAQVCTRPDLDLYRGKTPNNQSLHR